MSLSNPARSLILFLAILAAFTACRWSDNNGNTAVPAAEGPKGKFPFRSKEPENFQCDIIETAGVVVRRKRLAMKGLSSRLDLDIGTDGHRAVLVTDKEYLIDIRRKIYAAVPRPGAEASGNFSELTRELLLRNPRTEFEEIGREGNIIIFRATTDGSRLSEVLISYDEAVGLPVKQEFYSLADGEKRLVFTIEILNISIDPDPALFELPPGFTKAAFDEVAGGTGI